ncbi:hypothetical protein BT69DRAFT_1046770 [Atractiella rhizophila]|nr:hypothetical protein BT69DRAFT_1046770 [Atractiella rhizophila]
MMLKELSMLSSPTAWFVILVTIHLVTQTTLQGEALDRNAFGLSVLSLIAEAPQNGLKVDLGNNSAVLLPQLENLSTTVNLPSTETDLSRTSVAPSSFSTISPTGTTSSVSVTRISTTRSQISSKPTSVATVTTSKEGKVTNSAVPRLPGITSDGEESDDEPDDDESDDDESDDDDTNASDETDADVSLGDSVAESLKAVVGKPLSELRSAAEGFVDSVESDFDNAVAGLVKRTGLKSPHRRRRMHKVPASLRDQLKRRKEEHESDSELGGEAAQDDRGSEVGFTVLGLLSNGRQLIVTEACAVKALLIQLNLILTTPWLD